MLLCVLLAGCSSVVEGFPENLPAAPSLSAVAATLKTVAAQAHLAEPVEASDPIRANPISSSPWLICLRSGQSEESKRLTYSAFFTESWFPRDIRRSSIIVASWPTTRFRSG
jgi:hypothetical protein